MSINEPNPETTTEPVGASSLEAARNKVLDSTTIDEDQDEPVIEEEQELSDDSPSTPTVEEPTEDTEEEEVEETPDPILARLEEMAAKLDKFTAKEEKVEEVKEPDWAAYLSNQQLREYNMKKLGLDPTNQYDYYRYESHVAAVAQNWHREQQQKQIEELKSTIKQYQEEQRAAPIIKETVTTFNKVATTYNIPKSIERPLQSRVADLVQEGIAPKVAVAQAFKEFSDVVKPKAKTTTKDPVKARMQAASAVVGVGNNSNFKSSGTAKKGSKASLELVRSKLFSSR